MAYGFLFFWERCMRCNIAGNHDTSFIRCARQVTTIIRPSSIRTGTQAHKNRKHTALRQKFSPVTFDCSPQFRRTLPDYYGRDLLLLWNSKPDAFNLMVMPEPFDLWKVKEPHGRCIIHPFLTYSAEHYKLLGVCMRCFG